MLSFFLRGTLLANFDDAFCNIGITITQTHNKNVNAAVLFSKTIESYSYRSSHYTK